MDLFPHLFILKGCGAVSSECIITYSTYSLFSCWWRFMLFSPFLHYKQYWNENTATHIAHCPLTVLASMGESIEKLLEKIKALSRVVSYKMNISKSIAFLICQQESLRNFNEKGDPIHNSNRSINYLGINNKRCLRSVWTEVYHSIKKIYEKKEMFVHVLEKSLLSGCKFCLM